MDKNNKKCISLQKNCLHDGYKLSENSKEKCLSKHPQNDQEHKIFTAKSAKQMRVNIKALHLNPKEKSFVGVNSKI